MKDISDIIDSLAHAIPILDAFASSIPKAALHRRRGDGFWTISEHINHLAAVQPMLAGRIKRFLEENAPEFIPFIPADNAPESAPPALDMAAAAAAFAEGRREQIRLLKKAAPDDWVKEGRHPEYDRYTLYILARHILMHDHWHLYRVEELWLTKDAYLTALAG